MSKKAKVLFISQEIAPYLEGSSSMSQISRKLPHGVQESGSEVRIFMPRFGCINERRNQLHEVIRLSGMNLIIDEMDHPLIIKVASVPGSRMQVYFIDNEEYFQRKSTLVDAEGTHHVDNADRAVFFCRGVMETVKKLNWIPDVIHCHGWMSSLVPFFVKTGYKDDPVFKNAKIVLSMYNDEFPCTFDNFSKKLKMDGVTANDLKTYKSLNYTELYKNAIAKADGIVVNTETLQPELKTAVEKSGRTVIHAGTEEELIASCVTLYEELLEEEVFAD